MTETFFLILAVYLSSWFKTAAGEGIEAVWEEEKVKGGSLGSRSAFRPVQLQAIRHQVG